jgi:hypothetical protein
MISTQSSRAVTWMGVRAMISSVYNIELSPAGCELRARAMSGWEAYMISTQTRSSRAVTWMGVRAMISGENNIELSPAGCEVGVRAMR